MFTRYLDAGGNFVDTASAYAEGRSEELLGMFLRETASRDRIVLPTKSSAPADPSDRTRSANGTSCPRWTRRCAGSRPTT